MAKRKGIMFIAFGAMLAVVVGVLVFIITQNASNSKVQTMQVVVAAQDILDRSIIQPGALAVKAMPVDAIPVGAFTKTDQVIGKMAPSKIYAGEIILSSKLVDSKGQTGLSFTMDKGKILVTFPAASIVGLGLVHPGDAVDILVTLKPRKTENSQQQSPIPGSLTPSVTQATMQDLKVVTIGGQANNSGSTQQQQPQQQPGQAAFITFAVEPQDALTLKSLKDSDDLIIELALRSAGDDDTYKTEPTTIKRTLERYGITPNLLTQ